MEKVKKFKSEVEAQHSALNQAQVDLDSAKAELAAEREEFEKEKRRMSDGKSYRDVLVLNLGGEKTVSVQRGTLCAVPNSMLASSFSGRWDDSLARTDGGAFLIDFDPDLFLPLLCNLRMKRIADHDNPVEEPEVNKKRLPEFKRMLSHYGLLESIMPSLCIRPLTFKFLSLFDFGFDIRDDGLTAERTGYPFWMRTFGDVTVRFSDLELGGASMAFRVCALGDREGPTLGVADVKLERWLDRSETRNGEDVWAYNCTSGLLLAPKPSDIIGANPRPPAAANDEIVLILLPARKLKLIKNGSDLGIIFKNLPCEVKPVVEANGNPAKVSIISPNIAGICP